MPSLVRRRESKVTGKVSWVGQVPVGKSPDGSTRYLRETFKLKREADSWVRDVQQELKTGGVVEPAEITVREYLKHWMEAAARPSLRENTAVSYRNVIDLYLVPHLGDVRLADLRPLMVQMAYGKLQANGVGPRTVRYAHSVLHNALDQAMEWRMVGSNATKGVKLPKHQRAEIRPLNADEAADFVVCARSHRLGALLELALVTGMRPSELRALHWSDVDLDAGLVRVRWSLTETEEGWRLSEPKSKRGNRTIPIPVQTAETLRGWKKRQASERMEAGRLWKGTHRPADGLVFTALNGQSIERRNLANRAFKPVINKLRGSQMKVKELAEAGIPADAIANETGEPPETVRRWISAERVVPEGIRMYDLRHTCATLMLLAGVNPKVVSERLGHASVVLTLDTYSHVLPNMQADATERIAGVVYRECADSR
jgi:integrase